MKFFYKYKWWMILGGAAVVAGIWYYRRNKDKSAGGDKTPTEVANETESKAAQKKPGQGELEQAAFQAGK